MDASILDNANGDFSSRIAQLSINVDTFWCILRILASKSLNVL